MKSYFGYTRVSTAKQGVHGVSLIEQKAAIERYADKNALRIVEWFEERETAAKRGRPVFNRMLSALRTGRVAGVLIHKIDRSARNLKDWADLGELIDAGVEVHFAADALDLNSRGGRLSADIQAVVAADYIRNLREETRKGFYGRLKQGIYPLAAPIGYLNQGGGKAKVPDPATAPFIRLAFDLYASGRYSLRALQLELARRGFRRPGGRPLYVSHLALLLHNPFYVGIIRLKRSGETFRGVHAPLVRMAVFDRVQDILAGKRATRLTVHDFAYRRLFACELCGTALIGERQKGRVYYRCHTTGCPTAGAREDMIEEEAANLFRTVELTAEEAAEAKAYLAQRQSERGNANPIEEAQSLTLAHARDRLTRLTDAYVDGLLDKTVFEERRATLITDITRLEDNLAHAGERTAQKHRAVSEILELAERMILGFEMASPQKKRGILETTTSNRTLNGKNLAIRLRIPFERLAKRHSVLSGAPHRRTPRTSETCATSMEALFKFIDDMLDDDETSRGDVPELHRVHPKPITITEESRLNG